MKPKIFIVLFLLISLLLVAGCIEKEDPELEDIRKVLRKGLNKKLVYTPIDEEQASSSGESSTAVEPEKIEETKKIGKEEKEIPGDLDKKVVTGRIEAENNIHATSADEPSPLDALENTDETKKADKEEKGVYIAKGDESLLNISAREDVYGDPLKWVLLFRFNREAFGKIGIDDALPEKIVPAETKLKVVSPEDTKSISGTGTHWVVNVLSFREGENIVTDIVRLVENGFAAYITKANIKGQDYVRLRVGFFNEKTEAENEGKKIMALLNTSDFWITKADEAEFKEYGGYK